MIKQYGITTNPVHADLVDILNVIAQLRRLAVSMEYRIPDGAEYSAALLRISRNLANVHGALLYIKAQLPDG